MEDGPIIPYHGGWANNLKCNNDEFDEKIFTSITHQLHTLMLDCSAPLHIPFMYSLLVAILLITLKINPTPKLGFRKKCFWIFVRRLASDTQVRG